VTNHAEGQARAYYDDFSTGYERERHHGYHALLDELELGVAVPFARGRDLLEVGCGTGLILSRLAEVARRAEGVDLSPGMLEKARSRGLTVHEASATELPYPDASFDTVLSFKVLAHVPDVRLALAEMARVCRPGGRVLAELYNPWSLRFLAKRPRVPARSPTAARKPTCTHAGMRRRSSVLSSLPRSSSTRCGACASSRRPPSCIAFPCSAKCSRAPSIR
jgi:ubiquinone/menaquinone biosynthesis C-methylase UbiE